MSYNTSIGAFMERDPIGYDDGMNLYNFVGNNPLKYVDPLGLYKINWDGFTPAEQQTIQGAFNRIQGRVNNLMNEINQALQKEKCQAIQDILNNLKSVVGAMQADLDPNKGDHFDLSKNNFNPDAPLRWTSGFGTNIEFNTNAKKPWNTLPQDVLDETLFHELTHEQGNDDGEANNDFNNAHMLAKLMNGGLDKWIPLRAARMNAKCKCNATPASQPAGTP